MKWNVWAAFDTGQIDASGPESRDKRRMPRRLFPAGPIENDESARKPMVLFRFGEIIWSNARLNSEIYPASLENPDFKRISLMWPLSP